MRINAKNKMHSAENPNEKSRLDALQSSYKILINSFYGYLGYARGLFNDYSQADNVTSRGQEILHALIEEIRRHNGKVIEVDTDGIFFVPALEMDDEKDEEQFLRRIAGILPENIKLALGGRYEKMLSYKMKNYALLGYDGRIVIKGSSLVSRSMERFGRNYIQHCVECLLKGDIEGLHTLYVHSYEDIIQRRVDIRELVRTETLRESREQYEREVAAGSRNRTASYEVALSAGMLWKPGKRISYYVTGSEADVTGFKNCKLAEDWDPNFRDENVQYYLRRLNEFSRKFEPFFLPQDFRAIFSPEDLFDFSSKGIGIITSQVSGEGNPMQEDEGKKKKPVELSIWLDTT